MGNRGFVQCHLNSDVILDHCDGEGAEVEGQFSD